MIKAVSDVVRIVKRFLRLVKNHRGYVVILTIGSIIGHGAQLLTPIFTANLIQALTEGRKEEAMMNVVLVGATYLAYNFGWFLNYFGFARNARYINADLNNRVVKKILTYDINFTERIPKSTILNTISSDITGLSALIDDIIEMGVVMLKVVVMLVVFVKTNLYIGLAVIAVQYLYMMALNYNNIRIVKYLAEQKKYRDYMTDVLTQILNGFVEVRTLNVQKKVRGNFNVLTEKWAQKYLKRRHYITMNEAVVPMIPSVGKLVLFAVLGLMVLQGQIEISALIFLTSYFSTMRNEIKALMKYSREMREYDVSIQRVMRIVNYRNLARIEFGDLAMDDIDGTVRFRNVAFSYKMKNNGSVSGVNFVAEPNQITALVGHSGSGKTTLTNLLLRRYQPDRGAITIDGKNIYRYSKAVYAKNVAAVNQSPFMFNMSIRKNLGLVDPNLARQQEACKRVGLHDYIVSLPNGYNTVLSENAANFSGGQKQLLAIARALLSNAEILIFDEVTSALDAILVERIKEVFDNLKQDHTIIIVTHKKDIMQMADKIVVIHGGKMVGVGTHAELMRDNSYYIDIQTSSYLLSKQEEILMVEEAQPSKVDAAPEITPSEMV